MAFGPVGEVDMLLRIFIAGVEGTGELGRSLGIESSCCDGSLNGGSTGRP